MKTGKFTVLIVLLSLILGVFGGIAGSIISRIYMTGNDYKVPFFGEINYSESDLNRPNLIIRDAKKIVIDQEIKIDETVISIDKSIAGLYKKKKMSVATELDDILESYYRLDDFLAEGLVVTADGWVLFNAPATIVKIVIPEDYVIITKDKRLFDVDKFQKTIDGEYFFAHAESVNDLPVRRFFDKTGMNRGKTILVRGMDDLNLLTNVIGEEKPNSEILSSDESNIQIIMSNEPGEIFRGHFIFDLSGDIVGLVDNRSKVVLIDEFNLMIRNLLEGKEIKRASLGIEYVLLDSLLENNGTQRKGAMVMNVAKKSSADEAGLKYGDIILFINNIEINSSNKIAELIEMQSSGDIISVSYQRNSEDLRTDLKLK